jgi:4-hydroxybenzoate polyprenyltransferase
MRIQHWVKNGLIFMPLLFSGLLMYENYLLKTFVGMLSFCFLASFVYIVNDIQDVDKDRLHEKKRNRPIASGAITIRQAKIISTILLVIALILNLAIARVNIEAWLTLIAYFAINLLYSIGGWKNIPLLDVVILVIGFFLRVLYGAVLTDITISAWLYLVIISGAFYMGFGKRRNELNKVKENTREVLKSYTLGYLDKNLNACMTLSIAFYALWCIEKNNTNIGKFNFLLTVPILMVIFFKYGLDIEGNSDGDPVDVILHDRVLIVLVTLFICVLGLMIYLG